MTNPSGSQAWHFAFRGLSTLEQPAGLTISPKGGIETAGHAESVRQAILLLICTRPGERVMRPEYGCSLFRLAFSPNDDTTAGLAIHYVSQAIERWESRIDILRLNTNPDELHPNRLEIHLQYRLRFRADTEHLSVFLDLRSGRAY
ncbi:MAG: GPW/gp25 family protein [Burkholderiaceae bacterium]|nr:GPW/gp25 family protein [Burkholderiaceae bacterium]